MLTASLLPVHTDRPTLISAHILMKGCRESRWSNGGAPPTISSISLALSVGSAGRIPGLRFSCALYF